MGEIISSWSAPSGLPRGPGANSRHHVVAGLQAPLEHLGVFAVGQAGDDRDGPQQIAVNDPNVAPFPLLVEPGTFVDGDSLQRGLAVVVGFGALFGPAFENGHVLGADLLGDRIEPEGRVRDLDDVLTLVDLERQAGGHSGEQIEVRIGSGDDDRIGDDILFRGRAQTDLENRAAEDLVGVGVDREGHRVFLALGLFDQSDVGFVDRSVDVHLLPHIGGDHEQLRCLELGGHRLARVDFTIDDDAVDGRADLGIVEIRQGGLERRLGLVDGRPRDLQLGLERHAGELVLVEVGLGDDRVAPVPQNGGAFFVVNRLLQLRLHAEHVGLLHRQRRPVVRDGGLIQARIDLRQQIPLFDLLIEFAKELQNRPRDERAD